MRWQAIVSVRLIVIVDNFIECQMRYNECSYYRANPFFRQGYLPDIALYNRKEPQSFSEIPQGDQFFTGTGRKHYDQKFQTQIEQNSIFKTPERYPFDHRIAMDKNYRRNLDTIDIEGAASSTFLTSGVKNKMKAQEELARRQNQSVDNSSKQRTLQEQRRDLAIKQYEEFQEKQRHQSIDPPEQIENQISQNVVSRPRMVPDEPSGVSLEYKKYVYQNSSNKYVKPRGKVVVLEPESQKRESSLDARKYEQEQRQQEEYLYAQYLRRKNSEREALQTSQNVKSTIGVNNRHKSNPEYTNNYQLEFRKRLEQQQRNAQLEDKLNSIDPKSVRRVNPTNLSSSFNAAAHQIIGI